MFLSRTEQTCIINKKRRFAIGITRLILTDNGTWMIRFDILIRDMQTDDEIFTLKGNYRICSHLWQQVKRENFEQTKTDNSNKRKHLGRSIVWYLNNQKINRTYTYLFSKRLTEKWYDMISRLCVFNRRQSNNVYWISYKQRYARYIDFLCHL